MRKPLVALIVLLAGVPLAGADSKLTILHHSDPAMVMGQPQPAQDSTQVMWIGTDRVALVSPEQTLLVAPSRFTIVDHGRKTYTVIDAPVDFEKLLGPEVGPAMSRVFAAMKITAKVTPTGESRKIGQWNCRRYVVEIGTAVGGGTRMDVWASKDVPVDPTLFLKLLEAQFGLQPGMAAALAEMKKIEGFHVLTETTTTMMGSDMKSRQELVSAEQATPPPGTYDVPAGYEQVAFDPLHSSDPS